MFFIRLLVRLIQGSEPLKVNDIGKKKVPVMLIGAGEAGSIILNEIKKSTYVTKTIRCIIDDDPAKKGTYLSGIPVVGNRNTILRNAVKFDVEEIILAIPTIEPKDRKDILEICKQTGCRLSILPGLYQLINSEVTVSALREVEIEDLLGREPVKANLPSIMSYVKDRVVFVTGGGGSIGSEICRQIARYQPKKLVIIDNYENNAYEIQMELKRTHPELDLKVLIVSVQNHLRIHNIFEDYKPDIVFHAAAHKHVPLMEDSPNEAIKNNVFGTYKTARAADKYGVKKFVLISTDKAVNPTNIMGASKRLCEMVIQSMDAISKAGRTDLLPMLHAHVDEMTDGMLENDPIDEIAVDNIESSEAVKIESVGNKDRNGTQFVAVRFGNVLGSNGSVIPLFKKQIEAGGPVTVTHPDIIRYFMTIPEAVSLVLQAGTYAWGGEIFVLDMGAPVKIDTLARNLIRLSGYKPDVDIKIVYSGLRPGEKLFEEKLMAEEGMMKTDNELIHIGKPIPFDTETFLGQLGELARASYNNDENIVEMVEKIVPTFSPVGDKPTGNEKYGRNDVAVSAAK